MNTRQNLHTHTVYCDGKNTPEELVQAAMAKGHGSIGFSGHSHMFYSDYAGITQEKNDDYVREIRRLQKEYEGRFDIFLGLEVDMYSKIQPELYQYLIGSVHFLKIGEEYVGFDGRADKVRNVIDTWFGGDGEAFMREYFLQLAQLPQHGTFDIIGHFDLISKHVETTPLVAYDSDAYVKAGAAAAEALAPHIPLFEVNTGAMARGYRSMPYPSARLIKILRELGFGVIITSDCHQADKLNCGYELSRQLLAQCGYKERFILTKTGFIPVAL